MQICSGETTLSDTDSALNIQLLWAQQTLPAVEY
jgi:hypothetical protein